jgi:hypothetical protein
VGAAQGQTDGMAIGSLISGIVGALCCLGILSPVAFFLGLSSRGKIRDSRGTLKGDGLALAGMILGVLGTIELIGWIIVLVLALARGSGPA